MKDRSPPRAEGDAPSARDTIVVPAHPDGFQETFLGKDCWYAVRISAGMLNKILYIAGYQTVPVGAITHYAKVLRIEPYGEEGKYKLVFNGKATAVGPIPFGNAPKGSMQGVRYTSIAKLLTARTIRDLVK